MKSELRLVMLAGRDESTTLIYNGLKNHFAIDRVIIEPPLPKRTLLKIRLAKYGLGKVIGQILFLIFSQWLRLQAGPRLAEIKSQQGLSDEPIDPQAISVVESANDDRTVALLRQHDPDLVLVNGTRILKKEVFDSVRAVFINTHAGITPKYRGVHGGYWALAENDPSHCGVTIHLVDAGVDTGGILAQALIRPGPRDNFFTYPLLQVAAALPLLRRIIPEAAAETPQILSVDLPSKIWTHPTLIEYIKNRLIRKIK